MANKLTLLFIAALTLYVCDARKKNAIVKDAADCSTYPCLIFDEQFNDFDLDVWEHEITASGGGNWEFQYYTNNRSNSYVRDGVLFLKPTLTSDKYGEAFLSSGTLDLWGGTPASLCTGNSFWGCSRGGNPVNIINPIQSARIRSTHSFDVKYGRIEISAKMPTGDWIWPAIWMMPTREPYGGWPASGEIDLVESRGNRFLTDPSGVHKGVNSAGSTLHWGPFWPYNGYERTTGERQDNYGETFHRYELQWSPSSIRLLIDGHILFNAAPGQGGFWDMGNFGLPPESNPWRYSKNRVMAPFDQPFYFILNVAVGGTNGFFPDNFINRDYPKPWANPSGTAFLDFWNARHLWYPTWNANTEDSAMQVQSIRVWKMEPDPQ